jgi:hypothetical protein
LAWQPNGNPVCTNDFKHERPLILSHSAGFEVLWYDHRSQGSGIFHQIITPDGNTMLAENGLPILQKEAGSCQQNFVTIQRNTGVAAIWIESHNENREGEIRLQYIQPDGNMVFPAAGKVISYFTDTKKTDVYAVRGANDQIAIAWCEYDLSGAAKTYAQLVDENGNLLWGEQGITLSAEPAVYQGQVRVSFEDNAFYFG